MSKTISIKKSNTISACKGIIIFVFNHENIFLAILLQRNLAHEEAIMIDSFKHSDTNKKE